MSYSEKSAYAEPDPLVGWPVADMGWVAPVAGILSTGPQHISGPAKIPISIARSANKNTHICRSGAMHLERAVRLCRTGEAGWVAPEFLE